MTAVPDKPHDASRPSSPCIGVCSLDARHHFCVGCWRNMDEISRWLRMSDAEKRLVLEQCNTRREWFAARTQADEGTDR